MRMRFLVSSLALLLCACGPAQLLAADADARELAKTLCTALGKAGADKDARSDAKALRSAAKKADGELLAAIERAARRIAAEQAMLAATEPKLMGCAGQKEKALAEVAERTTAFADFPEALKILAQAKDEIENDKPGVILGEWWNGGALGSAYYTSPGARQFWWFEKPAKKIAKFTGLPYQEIHAAEVNGDDNDTNGILLYPDNSARARFLLMPGGSPSSVMNELGKNKGCRYVREAFQTGMNYIGICSGCCLVMNGCFKMWPGNMSRKAPKISGPPHDIVFLPFHPLIDLFGKDSIPQVPFTGGINEMTPNVPNTEYIGFFRNGKYEGMEGKCAVMAYSPPDFRGGRLVVCPAHPEAKDPEFLVAMAKYAFRHQYALPRHRIELDTPVKGICGDHQNLYYEVKVDEGVKKIVVTLSDLDANCKLSVRHGAPPKPINDSVKSSPKGKPKKRHKSRDQKKTVSRPKPGILFILIHGSHDVLNGANFTLSVTAERDGGAKTPAAP